MKIDLKPIIDQLTEVIKLPKNQSVSALIDDDGDTLVGWTVVNVYEDGTIKSITSERFNTIKDLIGKYNK